MKILAKNKRATFDYEINDKLVAGLVLSGSEVKSAKAGHASLKGSFVIVRNNEAYLTNAHIDPYASSAHNPDDPTRARKLLLHRRQIETLIGQRAAGLNAIPLALFEDR